MKFKSLFRRKASPTGNDANTTMSPSASSISHSSSSSSIATNSASSPVHSANGIDSPQVLSTSPITITSRIRSPVDSATCAVQASPPALHSSAQFLLFHDEAASQSEYPIATANHEVAHNHSGSELKAESEYEDSLAMRDIPASNWEQHSRRSSGSEVSLACLQGRIQQMEETHHSTNEELQATLQELADLQVQLNESQAENYKLNEEKLAVKRKLELRTEQFQQAREQVETMKQHLLLQCNESEDERKALLGKQTELTKLLSTQQAVTSEREQHVTWLKARVRNLETSINEGDSKLHSELSKLLKENEKLKQDKESTEGTALNAQDQLAQALKDNLLLKQQISALQEESRALKQKSKEEVADLEYKLEQLLAKKQSLVVETGTLHSAVAELESACRRHLEDKREMRTAAAEQQLRLSEAMLRKEEQEKLVNEERIKWTAQREEWQQFQKDLLTTVRVANDFKLETLAQMEKVLEENRQLREKLVLATHNNSSNNSESNRNATPVKPRVLRSLSTVDTATTDVKPRAIATRVDKGLSVKRIIENLETSENLKASSRQKSADVSSPGNHSAHELSPPVATVRPRSDPIRPTQLHRTESETVFLRSPVRIETRSSLGDPIYSKTQPPPLKIGYSASDLNPLSSADAILQSDRKDPLAGLVKNGGSKRNALLKWCQTRTANYPNIDITNFSSSWNDGLALCALLHTYLPDAIPFETLSSSDVRHNFQVAFRAAESIGIPTSLDIDELATSDRPDWQSIMTYITAIYKHFEI